MLGYNVPEIICISYNLVIADSKQVAVPVTLTSRHCERVPEPEPARYTKCDGECNCVPGRRAVKDADDVSDSQRDSDANADCITNFHGQQLVDAVCIHHRKLNAVTDGHSDG